MVVLDLHGCMILFAILSMVGIVFVVAVLKETSGQPLDEISYEEQVKLECARARSLSFG